MAIQCYIIQDTRKNGTRKYYVRHEFIGTVTQKEIAKAVQDSCTAKKSDVAAIIAEFHNQLNYLLRMSMTVNVDGLGRFYLGLTSTGSITAEDWSPHLNIKSVNVNFRPELVKREGVSYNRKHQENPGQAMYRLASAMCDGVSFEVSAYDKRMREKFAKETTEVKTKGWNAYMGRVKKKTTATT